MLSQDLATYHSAVESGDPKQIGDAAVDGHVIPQG
jgi:hypothetical protein